MAVAKGSIISKQIYTFLDGHKKYTLKRVQDVFNQYKKAAVKSAYYRWHKKRNSLTNSKRSRTVSKNNGTVGNKGSPIKRRKSPVNLSKIDETLLEKYLLILIDFDHPDVRIAREISNFIDRKKGFIQEEPVRIEFLGVDLNEQIALAEAYRTDIEAKVPK